MEPAACQVIVWPDRCDEASEFIERFDHRAAAFCRDVEPRAPRGDRKRELEERTSLERYVRPGAAGRRHEPDAGNKFAMRTSDGKRHVSCRERAGWRSGRRFRKSMHCS
jgi:hypothetical protein